MEHEEKHAIRLISGKVIDIIKLNSYDSSRGIVSRINY